MARKKKSRRDTKRAIEAIESEIAKEKEKRKNSGATFTSLTREQLRTKLQQAESPMITYQAWSSGVPPGASFTYDVGVYNPDPISWAQLAVAVSVGNQCPITSADLSVSNFDSPFSTLAQQAPIGFSLGPMGSPTASTSLSFTVKVPSGVEKTGYFGNTVLQQLNFHGVSKYLDRALFFFGVE